MNNILTPEQYAAAHKQAFRIAFDFLNSHFPPEETAEWWERTANDASLIDNMFGENRIVIHLMVGVLEYLEEVSKRRKELETESGGDG